MEGTFSVTAWHENWLSSCYDDAILSLLRQPESDEQPCAAVVTWPSLAMMARAVWNYYHLSFFIRYFWRILHAKHIQAITAPPHVRRPAVVDPLPKYMFFFFS